MESVLSASDWEAMFAPYDPQTYQAVLAQLGPEDVILDIGAGDLRLSRRMAQIARKVYAVEINAGLLDQAQAPSRKTVYPESPHCQRIVSDFSVVRS